MIKKTIEPIINAQNIFVKLSPFFNSYASLTGVRIVTGFCKDGSFI